MLLNRIFRAFFVVFMISAGITVEDVQGQTFAERLGWPEGTKAVIFHVDDAGMSHNSNMGAIKAIEDGVATSMSIMMPCPWVPEISAYVKENPQVDAGVHLTLTAEWKKYRWGPVAGGSAVPGLVDSDGYMWHGVLDVAGHATADEVEAEMRAQIDKAEAMGIKPTHLDSHMGTCFHPLYLERYVKLGIEKQIPILMMGGHMQHISAEAEAAALKPMVYLIANKVWQAGLPVIDDLVTSPTSADTYDGRKEQLITLLGEMKPGITQIIVHCTVQTEVFSHISGSGKAREAETRLMTDPDIKKFIENEGIILTSWRELHQRRRRVQTESEQ
ncbi:MAG: polysaccharide deacetylase family protein [Planctomycetota bacterium]|jgi:predicted glycoside hydrolase/deacetylase ChbG (UPF0249 family)